VDDRRNWRTPDGGRGVHVGETTSEGVEVSAPLKWWRRV
jgi:hypothetical protein